MAIKSIKQIRAEHARAKDRMRRQCATRSDYCLNETRGAPHAKVRPGYSLCPDCLAKKAAAPNVAESTRISKLEADRARQAALRAELRERFIKAKAEAAAKAAKPAPAPLPGLPPAKPAH